MAIRWSKTISLISRTYWHILRPRAKIDEAKIESAIPDIMNLSPRGIREKLQLNKPIYEQTAAYGHFGRTHDSSSGAFSWEALDLVSDFKSLA